LLYKDIMVQKMTKERKLAYFAGLLACQAWMFLLCYYSTLFIVAALAAYVLAGMAGIAGFSALAGSTVFWVALSVLFVGPPVVLYTPSLLLRIVRRHSSRRRLPKATLIRL
jgi:hypothetical protein